MAEHFVYLALGTNLGDRLANLRNALAILPPRVVPVQFSHIYETEPWGYANQPAFLNMVIAAETSLSPAELLVFLQQAEGRLGRQVSFPNGPRLIDLDILFYDDWIVATPPLVIPHPRLHERAFVLVPLTDIAPDHLHPVLGETTWRLLQMVNLAGIKGFAAHV